ncbi:hypothetical protein [Faecalibaculum rodentium]|jgi:hypothetical protein|uniref:Uncharacterized protein n=2 Tax=Faecalibaculum rodentium TaxID=1702221 RepID=A0A1Q9YHH7_9FIRM|nr:hypothetical protein [Faecalibaculum rodentium]OLU43598.1 hypothetical protein BO223_11545 [Faecalibaculum rodentium]
MDQLQFITATHQKDYEAICASNELDPEQLSDRQMIVFLMTVVPALCNDDNLRIWNPEKGKFDVQTFRNIEDIEYIFAPWVLYYIFRAAKINC